MPFTVAHPAAVLPLKRLCPHYLSWSALIIGAVTPDLEYFLTLRPKATLVTDPLDTIYFCLPAGLLLFVLFHAVVKRPAVLLLPRSHRRRLWSLADRVVPLDTRRVFAVLGSILIGASSHMLWDSFTHEGRWGVDLLPGLSAEITSLGGHTVPAFKILQHGSTALGIGSLALAYLLWFSRAPDGAAPEISAPWRNALRWSVAVIPFAVAMVLGILAGRGAHGLAYLQQLIGRFSIAFLSFGAMVLLACSVLVILWKDRLTTGWR